MVEGAGAARVRALEGLVLGILGAACPRKEQTLGEACKRGVWALAQHALQHDTTCMAVRHTTATMAHHWVRGCQVFKRDRTVHTSKTQWLHCVCLLCGVYECMYIND